MINGNILITGMHRSGTSWVSDIIGVNNHFTISLGVENAGDYTNDRFGPFVGRAAYIEFSTKLKKGK